MTTKAYFIRHSKPDFSIKNDLHRPLTDEGIEKSKELVKLFKGMEINYIFCSPFERSIKTVEPISKDKILEIKIINDFRERKICDNWIDNFDEYAKNQWNDFSYKLVDGESLNEVQNRNIKALEKILKENEGKNIIIGTHGTALSTIINYYDKRYGYNDFQRIANIMPYVIEIEFDRTKYITRKEIKI